MSIERPHIIEDLAAEDKAEHFKWDNRGRQFSEEAHEKCEAD
jgi:hypothetical protein